MASWSALVLSSSVMAGVTVTTEAMKKIVVNKHLQVIDRKYLIQPNVGQVKRFHMFVFDLHGYNPHFSTTNK